MSRRRLVLAWLLATLGLPGLAANGEDIPVRGARGYALTVVEGSAIERVPVEFLGTLDDFAGPGLDLHLVRLDGPVADLVGVASGMSGSPVYFGNVLLGALSYRLGAFPREPIGGVTPFADVLTARRAVRSAGAGDGDAGENRARPIAIPVRATGLAAPVLDWLAPRLTAVGLHLDGPGAGASGATRSGEDGPPLAPGAPVAVTLMRGDASLAAAGTVTWVDEDTVYAFGHPFFGGGRTEMPMHRATVIHTLADSLGSTKLTRVGSEVGAIVEDRLTSVVGRKGIEARMLPVRVTVRGADYGEQTFRFEVVRDSQITGLLVGTAVANALIGNPGFDNEATMRARGRVVVEGQPDVPLDLSAAGQSASGHALVLAVELLRVLASLRDNPFQPVELLELELDVEVSPGLSRYTLESLVYDRGRAKGGDTLRLGCVLSSYRGERTIREIELTIPDDLPPDAELRVAVGSPEAVEVALGKPTNLRARTAGDLGDYLRALAERGSARHLTAVLYEVATGVVSRGELYRDLPPTAERLLSSRASVTRGARVRTAELDRAVLELDGPVGGGLRLRIRLARDDDDGEEGRE